MLYNRLRDNPKLDVPPRTFFFARQSRARPTTSPSSSSSSSTTSAGTLDADPATKGRLKVVFLPDYSRVRSPNT